MNKEYTAEEFKKVWKPGMKFEFYPNLYDCWVSNSMLDTPPTFTSRFYRFVDEPEETPITTTSDPVHRPNHYYVKAKLPENAKVVDNVAEIDCFSVSDALEFHKHHYIASAFAYIWRCLRKNNTVEDLKKAVVYLNKEIALREAK